MASIGEGSGVVRGGGGGLLRTAVSCKSSPEQGAPGTTYSLFTASLEEGVTLNFTASGASLVYIKEGGKFCGVADVGTLKQGGCWCLVFVMV